MLTHIMEIILSSVFTVTAGGTDEPNNRTYQVLSSLQKFSDFGST